MCHYFTNHSVIIMKLLYSLIHPADGLPPPVPVLPSVTEFLRMLLHVSYVRLWA